MKYNQISICIVCICSALFFIVPFRFSRIQRSNSSTTPLSFSSKCRRPNVLGRRKRRNRERKREWDSPFVSQVHWILLEYSYNVTPSFFSFSLSLSESQSVTHCHVLSAAILMQYPVGDLFWCTRSDEQTHHKSHCRTSVWCALVYLLS